jgi:hypothetical protein
VMAVCRSAAANSVRASSRMVRSMGAR